MKVPIEDYLPNLYMPVWCVILQRKILKGNYPEDFININPSIEGAWLAGLKRYPHLEDPVGFYNQLEVFL